MTIQEVLTQIGSNDLDMVQCYNEDKTPSEWSKHWDNDKRVMTLMPLKVLAKAKTSTTLNLKTSEEVSKTSGTSYVKHMITERAPVMGTLSH